MAEIADRVGIRKASLYNYYDSKADLMVELLELSLDDWEKSCRIEVPFAATIEERLAGYLAAAVRFARKNPQAVGIIRLVAGQMPRDLRQRVQQIVDHHDQVWRESLNQMFREAIERGEIRDSDPEELTLFWGVFVDGLLTNQIFGTAKSDAMLERIQSLWKMFWRGVGGRTPATELQV